MDYYGELCTKVYESGKSIAEGEELAFYLSHVTEGMKVLEPMCGNGRMLIPFMQRGIDIEGFDISDEMLKVCVVKGNERGMEPRVFHQDMRHFNRQDTYDLIMIPFGSFSLLPEEIVPLCLRNLKESLRQGGRLLITAIIQQEADDCPEWKETNRLQDGKNTIIEYKRMTYDKDSRVLNSKLKYHLIHEGEVIKEELMDFPMRMYGVEECKELLHKSGFVNVIAHEVLDGYGKGNPFHVFEGTI